MQRENILNGQEKDFFKSDIEALKQYSQKCLDNEGRGGDYAKIHQNIKPYTPIISLIQYSV
jgi:hypothetical protein